MIPIVTPDEMAAIDAAAPEPADVLIGRAGWAVAREARRLLGGTYGKWVVVIAGKGNNGADGRVAGELLARRGVRVTVVDPGGQPATGSNRTVGSLRPSSTRTDSADRSVLAVDGDDAARQDASVAGPRRATLPDGDLIIDAAFGTGLGRAYVAPKPADPNTPVLAVDIPSGVDGATGRVRGIPLRADVTVTFAAYKPGLVLGDGPDWCGETICVDIGLDTSTVDAWLVTAVDVAGWLPTRPRTVHKWRAAVRLVAGSPGMTGSADLATAAALRAGAGYVRRSTPGFDPAAPGAPATGPVEAVTTPLDATGWAAATLADIDRFGGLAIGPGLGRGPMVDSQVARIVEAPVPIVIDGDGLRALGDDPAGVLAARGAEAPPAVLTPHDAEFAGLGGDPHAEDRIAEVRGLAAGLGAVVLHKGSTTVVAHPDGQVFLVDAGDIRLATAGTGDVLTGIIGAFLARGVEPLEAAAAAAWVHGTAARRGRRVGFTASDLPGLVSELLSDLDER